MSENNIGKFKNKVFAVLSSYYSLSYEEAVNLSSTWLQEHQLESWENLSQLLENKKIIFNQKILCEAPSLPLPKAISLIKEMQGKNGVEIKNRRFRLKSYPDCFIGSEAVDWLMKTQKINQEEALLLGQHLLKYGLIHHVHQDHDFKNEFLFYQFNLKQKILLQLKVI